jgi:hypothetical protein
MVVEVFLREKFRNKHENQAFGRFLQEMLERFKDSQDHYLIRIQNLSEGLNS